MARRRLTTTSLRTVLRQMLLARGVRRTLVGGALLALATALAGSALLGLSGWFISATALAGLSVATALAFDVFMPSAGIRLLAIGRTGLRYAERLATHAATLRLLRHARGHLFRAWSARGAAARLRLHPARILFRLTHDLDTLEALYLRLVVPLFTALGATLVTACALAWWAGGRSVALLVGLLAGGVFIFWHLLRGAARAAARRGVALERMRAAAIDLVAGQAEWLMAGRFEAQRARLLAADAQLAESERTLERCEARAIWQGQLLHGASLAGALLVAGWLLERGVLSVPLACLLVLLVLAAVEPWLALRRGALEGGRVRQALRRLVPGFAPASPQAPVARPAVPWAAALASVDFRWPGSAAMAAPVLSGLSLRIAAGERVALVGASGSGKSTLFGLLAGELVANAGTVQAQPAVWLTQGAEIFHASVRDNLDLWRRGARDDDLWPALHAVELADDIARLPAGLDAMLGEGGLGLSGGQARRLALARVLLTDPHDAPLWLLDEPGEALDSVTAARVLSQVMHAAGPRTVLIATHLRREARHANRLLVLDAGGIVGDHARGSAGFAEVMAGLREG